MEPRNAKEWVSEPDVCRCCLITKGALSLTASYFTSTGDEEVFSHMIQECFGITLSYLNDRRSSKLICVLCASHLRDVKTFHKQVLRAEKRYTELYNESVGNDVEVSEIKVEDVKLERNFDDDYIRNDSEDEISKLDGYRIATNESSSPFLKGKTLPTNRKKLKKSTKVKRRRLLLKSDEYDSDTPISNFISSAKRVVENIEETGNNLVLDLNVVTDINAINRLHVVNSVKQLSERKKIITTCNIILKDTSACPFRHHKSWFQCFFCTEEFMEINLLKTHNSSNHQDVESELKKLKRYPRSLQIDISTLKCLLCSENLENIQRLKEHFEMNHKKMIYNECIADYKVNTSPFTCHICKQEFHVFRSLTTHINEHYANCICDVCGKSFINSKRLKVHKRTHEKGNYPCHECGKILKTKTSKANHMESAHNKRVLKCQICFKTMKHYNARIKHMSEAHDITHKFKCPICPREYNIKHYLATHLRQTHGHKNKKCHECGMAFITNHGLKKHMLKHTGEKPYTCEICSKSYARSYTLREHMRIHDNDRLLSNE